MKKLEENGLYTMGDIGEVVPWEPRKIFIMKLFFIGFLE